MSKKVAKSKDDDMEERIQILRHQIEGLSDGDLLAFPTTEKITPELEIEFLERVKAFEEAEWVTPFDLLVKSGVELPASEDLNNAQLTAKLWEIIHCLAMLRTFLSNTNHLDDRALYEKLLCEILVEETPFMSPDENHAWHIDLIGSGSDEDNEYYLRYYADEESRQSWGEDWPDDVIPRHETPPYDRDRYLPAHDQIEWRQSSQVS